MDLIASRNRLRADFAKNGEGERGASLLKLVLLGALVLAFIAGLCVTAIDVIGKPPPKLDEPGCPVDDDSACDSGYLRHPDSSNLRLAESPQKGK